MKRTFIYMTAFVLTIAATGQTLNVKVGNITYQFPAAQTGEMTYDKGKTVTIMGKKIWLDEIDAMTIDNTEVKNNAVNVNYDGSTANVTIAGNVAQYVDVDINDGHVTIDQTNTALVDEDEITYALSGTSTDGSLTLSGSFKCTVSLAGVTLTNPNGAAINITNKKRIQISAKKGTENTLIDGADGGQKACIYSKGQLQLQGNGTLTINGNTAHAIKSGDYIEVKNLTLNILSAAKDGINCNKYFLMKNGNVTINGVGDDGIQVDLESDDDNTGETEDHEDENSGNIYIEDGNINMNITAAAAKGMKSEGDLKVNNGTINIDNSGAGAYDAEENDAKGAGCLNADGNMTINGGNMTLKATGNGGKCIKTDGMLTITDGIITATTTGTKYTYSNQITASPKTIKSTGAMTISGGTIVATSAKHEAIESKSTLTITGGSVYAAGGDDGINSAGDMYLKGGYTFARTTSTGTGADGFDANGNLYVQGGTAFGISHGTPDVAFDANSESNKKLYVQSGNLVAIGGMESGASLTQSCYSTSSYAKGTWYGLYSGNTLVLAFQVPSTGTMGSGLIVSTSGTAKLMRGITVSDGTMIWNGLGYIDATVSGGSTVSLTSYNGGGSGPGGQGGPGRHW
ncbi:MAG: carbohydrate-binding domain-containing protein [Bacteroidaceae bacterium]|nr:carbohydrate-binding domain-containing protein [Bacteroidaceae bacterium]